MQIRYHKGAGTKMQKCLVEFFQTSRFSKYAKCTQNSHMKQALIFSLSSFKEQTLYNLNVCENFELGKDENS